MQTREKEGRKGAIFFPMIWSAVVIKYMLDKAAGAEPAGHITGAKNIHSGSILRIEEDVNTVHALVARRAFRSRHPQHTILEVELSKKRTPLWCSQDCSVFPVISLEKERSLAEFLLFHVIHSGKWRSRMGWKKKNILQIDGLIGKQIQKLFCISVNRLINIPFKKSIGGQINS